ncbi:hypothetical protein FOZ60_006992 [Perkinsus olseni]|uniref:Uncharacterized protein n=1 Tax=Perkinsus olseni TaxID=32597 RepID=A0A7J6NMI1_PEROL|nr:hypothetical protein FOZ60_006992 [Perkinsus olseni]
MATFQLPPHVEALRCMMVEGGGDGRVMPPELVGEVMDYCGRPMLRMDGPSEMVYAKEGFFESRRATPHGLNIFHYPRARRIELRSSRVALMQPAGGSSSHASPAFQALE